MKTIEIVTHCWSGPNGQYAKLLCYQLASILENPPAECHVVLMIFIADDDRRMEVLDQWERDWSDKMPPTVEIRLLAIERANLFQRPWGRNLQAKRTRADIVWFTDCDYLFGPGCLDALAQADLSQHKLFFPRVTQISCDHETGDKYLAEGVHLDINPADFIPKTEHKAIGGIQIVPGDVARSEGYVPHLKRYQTPAPEGTNTIIGFPADRAYRIQLGTPGTPIDLPNLYRLRHSETGDNRAQKAV